MTNRDRIAKAVSLIRPVVASLHQRRPAGISAGHADIAMLNIGQAVGLLEQALKVYDETPILRKAVPL